MRRWLLQIIQSTCINLILNQGIIIQIFMNINNFQDFHGRFGNKTRYFTFSVLPFGLCSSRHIFTKVVRVLVKYWRSLGFPIVIYLDDGLGTTENYELCEKMSVQVRDLIKIGFVANNEKSVWKPVQLIEWLGFIWNIRNSTEKI